MLTGTIVALRPFDRRHLERTRDWVNDPELARLLDRARPVGDAEHERWYTALTDRPDAAFFAVETVLDGRHVGNVWLWGIDARHRKAEVRILLGDPGSTGKGLGSEALLLLARYAFERLNLRRLYAYVLGTNPRARRAFEKAGFEVEGVLRQDRWVGDHYADVFLLGRLLSAAAPLAA
ncbi:MAG TPA: GNAT family protein [Gemmataceae bacterium]|nr:GNAT family protein [Gemmataceae bacterium]